MIPSLKIINEAARAGGQAALQLLPEAKVFAEKQAGDFSTTADIGAQAEALRVLAHYYPDIPVIAEENEGEQLIPESFFTVDPLDGTIIASRGCLEWGVLVSYVHRGEPEHAVLYQPALGRMITASRAQGCFLHEESAFSVRRLTFDNSGSHKCPERVMLDFQLTFATQTWQLEATLLELIKHERVFMNRTSGATVQAGFELLLGHTDICICPVGGKIWDYAPVALAVKEAGGEALYLESESMRTYPLRCNQIYMGILLARNADLARELSSLFKSR